MKKKLIYTLSIITIITAIAGLIIVVSFNKSDGEALAETIQTNTDYSLAFPSVQTIQTIQEQPPQSSVNKWVTLNGNFNITIQDIGYSLTGNKVLLFVGNGNVHYNFTQTESTSNGLQVFFLFNNNYSAGFSQNILVFSGGNILYSLKNNNFTHIDIKFTSLNTSTSLTAYETQAFSKFWQDLGNIVYNPTQYTTIEQGYYILDKNKLDNATISDGLKLDLTHKILTPSLESADLTGQRGYNILFSESNVNSRITWNGSGSLYPNMLLSSDYELYRRVNGVGRITYEIIKVETNQPVEDNIIAQALTPIPNESIMQYWLWGFGNDYVSAYNAGYDEGITQNIVSDNVTGLISAIFSGLFGSIFAVEIFPGFPLYIFILIPVVFAVIGLVFWLVRGR